MGCSKLQKTLPYFRNMIFGCSSDIPIRSLLLRFVKRNLYIAIKRKFTVLVMEIFNPNSHFSFIVNPPAEKVLSKINEFLQTSSGQISAHKVCGYLWVKSLVDLLNKYLASINPCGSNSKALLTFPLFPRLMWNGRAQVETSEPLGYVNLVKVGLLIRGCMAT